ncbi:vacuolar protein sorting 33B [Haematobia irritans]|uniref:vacuolar protein sorting 33B n=1 Tax=Haematobia irritans TaxID=7368 RepID=UPI003F4FEA97
MESTSLDKKLQGFQLVAQEKLQTILCSIPGKKDLIIEANLIKPLEHICSASWLKLKGIQRIFKLDSSNVVTRSQDQVQLYMIRSDLSVLKLVMEQIKTLWNAGTRSEDVTFKFYHVICVPSCFAYFAQMLEYEGLYGVVGLHKYNWDFIHLDESVLSMEVPNVFSSAFMRSDCSLIPPIAQSLRVLHILCGRPNFIMTYGVHSENILKILNNLGTLPKKSTEDNAVGFSAMLIVDRDKDFASPLLTPAIYSGLLIEVFNSNAGILELDLNENKIKREKLPIFTINPKKDREKPSTNSEQRNVKPASIRLNCTHDEIYADNRYKHFAAASSQIRQQAKSISMELQKLNNMKLDEMHDYVNRRLPKVTDLKTKLLRHLNASEKVIEMLGSNYRRVQTLEEDILNNVSRKKIIADIDELLTSDGHKFNTLRLLCLFHICAGITNDELSQFIRNYCNYFGIKYLSVFQNLAKIGFLPTIVDDNIAFTSAPLNKTATKLLSNIPLNIQKFHQTSFQANANRLKLMVSTGGGADELDNVSVGSASSISTTASATGTNTSSCPSYVFNRLYIPLIAQLSSFLLKSLSTDDFVSKLSMIDQIQINGQSLKSYNQSVKQGNIKDVLPLVNRKILVYVVGGITYAEIAACNLVSKLTESQIIVASDSIVTGADLIAGAF